MPGDLQGLVGTYHDISILIHTYVQWSFQEPKLEVPTTYKVYARAPEMAIDIITRVYDGYI
jgi:hypothetical protein